MFYPEYYWPDSSYSYWPIVTTVWTGTRPRITHIYEENRTLGVLSKDRTLIVYEKIRSLTIPDESRTLTVYEEDSRTDTVAV